MCSATFFSWFSFYEMMYDTQRSIYRLLLCGYRRGRRAFRGIGCIYRHESHLSFYRSSIIRSKGDHLTAASSSSSLLLVPSARGHRMGCNSVCYSGEPVPKLETRRWHFLPAQCNIKRPWNQGESKGPLGTEMKRPTAGDASMSSWKPRLVV